MGDCGRMCWNIVILLSERWQTNITNAHSWFIDSERSEGVSQLHQNRADNHLTFTRWIPHSFSSASPSHACSCTHACMHHIRQWHKYNEYVHTETPAACPDLTEHGVWIDTHTLHIVWFTSAGSPIANRSWLSQTRGLRAKTIQAVHTHTHTHTHNTVSCDRTVISTWHLENRKNVSAGTQMCWSVWRRSMNTTI